MIQHDQPKWNYGTVDKSNMQKKEEKKCKLVAPPVTMWGEDKLEIDSMRIGSF